MLSDGERERAGYQAQLDQVMARNRDELARLRHNEAVLTKKSSYMKLLLGVLVAHLVLGLALAMAVFIFLGLALAGVVSPFYSIGSAAAFFIIVESSTFLAKLGKRKAARLDALVIPPAEWS